MVHQKELSLYTRCKEALNGCLQPDENLRKDYLAIVSQLGNPNKDAATVGEEVAKIAQDWEPTLTRKCFCHLMMLIKQQLHDSQVQRAITKRESARGVPAHPPSPPRIHNNILIKMPHPHSPTASVRSSSSGMDVEDAEQHALATPLASDATGLPSDDVMSDTDNNDADDYLLRSDVSSLIQIWERCSRPAECLVADGGSCDATDFQGTTAGSDVTDVVSRGGSDCAMNQSVLDDSIMLRGGSNGVPLKVGAWSSLWKQPGCDVDDPPKVEPNRTSSREDPKAENVFQRLAASTRRPPITPMALKPDSSRVSLDTTRRDPWVTRYGSKDEVDSIFERVWQHSARKQEKLKLYECERIRQEEEKLRNMFRPNMHRKPRGPSSTKCGNWWERLYNDAVARSGAPEKVPVCSQA